MATCRPSRHHLAGALRAPVAPARAESPARRADSPTGSSDRLRLVVLDVRARGAVEGDQVEGLTQLLVSEAGRNPDLQVLGTADIRSVLGFEADRQLLACDEEASCLAEIGGAMNARFILNTDVSRVGRTWLLTVTLLDVSTVDAVHRATRRAASEDDLIDASLSALDEVLRALPGLQPSAGGEHVRVDAGTPRAGRGALAWGATAVGAGALLGGGLLYGLSWDTFRTWDGTVDKSTFPVDQVRTAKVQAPVGLGLAGVGVALIAGSFLLQAPHASPQPGVGPRLGVVPVPGGGALAVFGGALP